MVGLIYALIALATLSLAGAGAMAFHDRGTSVVLLALATTLAIAAGILALGKLNGEISAKGYARVRIASALDPGTDAMAQWALGDGFISLSEYAAIADAYEHDTGRNINKEPVR